MKKVQWLKFGQLLKFSLEYPQDYEFTISQFFALISSFHKDNHIKTILIYCELNFFH